MSRSTLVTNSCWARSNFCFGAGYLAAPHCLHGHSVHCLQCFTYSTSIVNAIFAHRRLGTSYAAGSISWNIDCECDILFAVIAALCRLHKTADEQQRQWVESRAGCWLSTLHGHYSAQFIVIYYTLWQRLSAMKPTVRQTRLTDLRVRC